MASCTKIERPNDETNRKAKIKKRIQKKEEVAAKKKKYIEKGKKGPTVPRLRIWSPTILLTRLERA